MFKYKNEAELSKMTAEERDDYAAQKRDHEASLVKETAKAEAQTIANALKAEISKDAFSPDSKEFKAMQKTIEDLNKSIEDLGKNKNVRIIGVNKKIGAEFQDLHKAKESGSLDQEKSERGEALRIETKAFDSLNVHSVSAVSAGAYPENGTIGLPATYRTVYAQILGMFDIPRVYSKIMDVVDISPLVADTLIAFNTTIVNGFAITPECTEKPASRISLTPQTVTANPVASLFYTTLQLRVFYPSLVNEFVKTFRMLLQESIPAYVMAQVRANAGAYTPVASLEWDAPSYFEAIVAVAAAQKKLGYKPNMVALSPIAYALMITEVGTNGQYKLQNGSSIVLVGDTIKIGSTNLTVVEDAELGDDEFMVGDGKVIKVGLGSDVYYFETDGVTDNQNAVGTAPATGLARNVRTHELAQFVAVIIPTGTAGGLTFDTFDNVITLVTAATPSV